MIDPTGGAPANATFGGDQDLLSNPLECLTQSALAHPLAVDGGSIKQIDALFPGITNQLDGLGLGDLAKTVAPPLSAERRSPQAKRRNLLPGSSKSSILHQSPPVALSFLTLYKRGQHLQRGPSLQLLTFAHLGEAREFIKNLPGIKARFDLAPQLYLSSKWGVLVTGEGMDRVFLHLGRVLAQLPGIQRVENFGIAAALAPELAQKQIVPVRTAYRSLASGMEFKSYSSQDGRARLDCVSTFQRIQNPEKARELRHFGDLLDRELWAIGAICDFYQIPFTSSKLISDYAGGAESCQEIRSLAREYSQLLYRQFLEHGKHTPTTPPPLPEGLGLYWTESLLRQFTALSKQWHGKYPNTPITELYTDDLREIKGHPKRKTILLLKKMKEYLYPVNTQVKRELDQLIGHHYSKKMKIHYDPQLESTELKISASISSPEDLEQLQKWAQHFPLQKIQQKIKGQNVS